MEQCTPVAGDSATQQQPCTSSSSSEPPPQLAPPPPAKPILSLVDEIAAVLASIPLPPQVQLAASVAAWARAGDALQKQQPIDWASLPAAVDAASTNMGVSTKLSAKARAKKAYNAGKVDARVARKRRQVESFVLVLRALVDAYTARRQQQQLEQQLVLHVVDFGCGTGALLLPLAALFPCVAFTGVDMKPAALALLRQRADAAGLSNVDCWPGMVERYSGHFDVALALHACGNATDHVLAAAVQQGAAFVVSPCCVGKLKFSLAGGSSFSSSGITWTPSLPGDRPAAHRQQQPNEQQHPPAELQQCQAAAAVRALQHPRSAWLRSQLEPEAERHFRTMARVADVAHSPADQQQLAEALQHRAAVADSCKQFVELDRCAAAAEAGYAVGLFKVLDADSMAKNDLLVGLPAAEAAGHEFNGLLCVRP